MVGVGVNVSTTRDELPVPSAGSLALAGAAPVDRGRLLGAVLASFTERYVTWLGVHGRGDAGLRTTYQAACSTVGRQVRVELPGGGVLAGRAVGVDPDGRLQVDDGARVHVLGAGDVVHVRPGAAQE